MKTLENFEEEEKKRMMGMDMILNSFTCLIFLGHIPGGRYRVKEWGLLKNEAIVSASEDSV